MRARGRSAWQNGPVLRRRLLIFIPALAVSLVVALMLGPARTRAVIAGRILAASAEDTSLRVHIVRRDGLADLDLARPFRLETPGGDALCAGETDASGVAECRLEAPLPANTELRLVSEALEIWRGVPVTPGAPPPAVGTELLGESAAEGTTVGVKLVRGALAPPFSGELEVSVAGPEGPASGAKVHATAVNAEPAELDVTTDASGRATLALTPVVHPVIVSLKVARAAPETGGVAATTELEVTAAAEVGAMYVPPFSSGEPIEVVSAGPRPRAFVSVFGARGRIAGGTLELALDEKGFRRGRTDFVAPEGTIGVIVSPDAREQSASTLAWPSAARGALRAPRLGVVADGLPEMRGREARRARLVRLCAVGLLSAAAALELLLLLWTKRRAQTGIADLERDVDRALDADSGASDEAGPRAALRATHPLGETALMLVVALGFGVVAALLLR